MPQDIIITPTTGAIQFRENAGTVMANIQLDGSNVLNITGNLSLGDPAANVFIGDGTSVVDVIFEQNGAIRALASKTLTLGQSDSLISFAANISSNSNIAGNLTIGNRVIVNTPTGSNVGLNVNGANTQGGTGFSDFLRATNTSGGATNPNKTFRLNSTGGIEIINSAYTVTIFTLTDAGLLLVPGPIYIGNKQAVNGPAFSAYANATLQTITSGSQHKVLFQTEEFDTNSCFDSTTNYRFTPNVAGYYLVSGHVQPDASYTAGIQAIYKNGSVYKYGSYNANATGVSQPSVTCLVYLNGSTDYVEFYGSFTTGQATVATSAFTWFQGHMARAA